MKLAVVQCSALSSRRLTRCFIQVTGSGSLVSVTRVRLSSCFCFSVSVRKILMRLSFAVRGSGYRGCCFGYYCAYSCWRCSCSLVSGADALLFVLTALMCLAVCTFSLRLPTIAAVSRTIATSVSWQDIMIKKPMLITSIVLAMVMTLIDIIMERPFCYGLFSLLLVVLILLFPCCVVFIVVAAAGGADATTVVRTDSGNATVAATATTPTTRASYSLQHLPEICFHPNHQPPCSFLALSLPCLSQLGRPSG